MGPGTLTPDSWRRFRFLYSFLAHSYMSLLKFPEGISSNLGSPMMYFLMLFLNSAVALR